MEWEAINTYFQSQGIPKLVEHQIESFEDFVRNKIPLIVASTAPIVVWHEQDEKLKKYKYELRLTFENVTYMKPRIQEATGRIHKKLVLVTLHMRLRCSAMYDLLREHIREIPYQNMMSM
jgi:DNA-directed RNA polymerase beta subunit